MPEGPNFPWHVANMGTSAVLALLMIWVVYYSMTRMLPAMLAQFTEQLKIERETCEKRHAENVAEMRLERDIRMRQHVELLSEKRVTHTEVMDGQRRSEGAFKENRHAIKGLAHQISTLAAVVKGVLKLKGLEIDLPVDDPDDTPTRVP